MNDIRAARGLGLACLMLLAACKTTDAGPKPGEGDCVGASCASNGPAVDWSAKKPTYKAHLRVVDTAGTPVKGATVKVGMLAATTDKDGRAEIGPLDAVTVSTIGVDKAGATPQVTKATAWTSSRTTQDVVVAAVGMDKMVDVQKRTTAEIEGAHLDVPARALALADGTRASAAHMQLTLFSGSEPDALLPGDTSAIDDQGEPTMLSKLGSVLYVHFEDMKKQKLNLAPGQSALLELPVSNDMSAKAGDTIPLWSLDEVAGNWVQQGSCLVKSRTVAGQAQQYCVGAVDHFSYWGVAFAVQVSQPGTMGCINTMAKAEDGACFRINPQYVATYRCDKNGQNCNRITFGRETFVTYPPDVGWCGVLSADDYVTYRVSAVYHTDTSGCKAEDGPVPVAGMRSKMSGPLDLASFKEVLGSKVMLAITVTADRDCPTLCTQVPLTITRKDLDSPAWTDRDDDGFYSVTDSNYKIELPLDCNDDDSTVHPYAYEPFCVVEDRSCDGVANKNFDAYTDIAAEKWNKDCGVCMGLSGVKLPLADEMGGNRYDENCDGVLADVDGDGQDAPQDCNDLDKSVHVGASEKRGNFIDEDCDGAALDADGDGVFNPLHVYLAEKLGVGIDQFVDCDDYDPRVKPSTPVSSEAGALARYFYAGNQGVRRNLYYCELFKSDGTPDQRYYWTARDLNCDGVVTDVDGDGYAAPGDLALGQGKDTDCNDYDPRIHPVSADDPTCAAPSGLLNDSECVVKSRAVGDGCPVLTLAGTDMVTRCEEATNPDGTGTGIGVCTYDGWWDGNPLVINPAKAWGPCDGDLDTAPLPACPEGASCGGPMPYTDAFSGYVQDAYLDGAAVTFMGMCFPSCDLTK